ncbi:molybdenum cofactor guanylyltransferase [Eikenella sp. Marseille-P7795]|uniref:molybdenum cofactor guanylyltransferase n=1 Tax=Eikenella sp. Marseille-P7795 TaxID=2866577 RepID=UPI001CE47687|nr:NTP transferase domain-containing protein [Eikenella sp. Marseille-P7795]
MASTAACREPLLILCGGLSRRMGRPKPLLTYRGVPLIERLAAAQRPLWLAAAGQRFPNIPQAHYLPDALPERQGALSAILPALDRAAAQGYSGVYVLSCDTLLLPEQVADCLQQARGSAAWCDGVAALQDGERTYPLLAHWSAALAEPLRQYLASGQRRVTAWLETVPFAAAPLPAEWRPLCNFNMPQEFEQAVAQAEWLSAQG